MKCESATTGHSCCQREAQREEEKKKDWEWKRTPGGVTILSLAPCPLRAVKDRTLRNQKSHWTAMMHGSRVVPPSSCTQYNSGRETLKAPLSPLTAEDHTLTVNLVPVSRCSVTKSEAVVWETRPMPSLNEHWLAVYKTEMSDIYLFF